MIFQKKKIFSKIFLLFTLLFIVNVRLLFTVLFTKVAIQFVYCNTLPSVSSSSVLQYNTPSFAIHLISLAVHLHFPCNTIPSTTHSSCNIIRVFQYKFFFSYCTLLQYNSSLLQYTYPAYLQASLQYNSLYCNTIFQPNKPSCNTNSCLAIQSPSQQASSCNTIFQANYTPKVAIQFSYCNTPWIHCTPTKPKSQYKAFYHNTIWAIA